MKYKNFFYATVTTITYILSFALSLIVMVAVPAATPVIVVTPDVIVAVAIAGSVVVTATALGFVIVITPPTARSAVRLFVGIALTVNSEI
jgi:hypothetical protein